MYRFGLILFYHKIYIDNNAYGVYNEIKLNESKKMKTKIQIILTILAIIFGIILLNHYDNMERANYAQTNGCEWSVYGGHDVCR